MPALPTMSRAAAVVVVAMAVEPRIGVMLAILFVSLFAVSFPSISKQVPFLRIPSILFFVGKHFGTGVILATAFIHLLDDAFRSLQKPAVEKTYGRIGKWTGAIILVSLLSIFLVEYISTSYVEHLQDKPSAPPTPNTSPLSTRPSSPKTCPTENTPLLIPTRAISEPSLPLHSQTLNVTIPLAPSRSSSAHSCHSCHSRYSHPHHHHHHSTQTTAVLAVGLPIEVLGNSPRICRLGLVQGVVVHGVGHGCGPDERHRHGCQCDGDESEHGHDHVHPYELDVDGGQGEEPQPRIGRRRQIVGILVLQLGIMIHSLVIGLTLAVTSGSDFASLTTAIIFHQLFEGFSLGIRIAALPPGRKPKPPHQHAHLHDEESDEDERELEDCPPGPESSETLINGSSSEACSSGTLTSGRMPAQSSSFLSKSKSATRSTHRHRHRHSHPHEHVHNRPSRLSRLSAAWKNSDVHWLQPTLSFLFAVTTPFGMGVGMVLFSGKRGGDKDDAKMLLTQGIMSAISAGMLIYAATVEMIAGDFVFGDVEGGHGHGHEHGHHHGHDHSHSHHDQHHGAQKQHQERGRQHRSDSEVDVDVEEARVEHPAMDVHPPPAETSESDADTHKKASVGKRVLAVVSLLAGAGMMVIVGLGE